MNPSCQLESTEQEIYHFVSSTLTTMKRDKAVKITWDSEDLNNNRLIKWRQLPNMEEIIIEVFDKIEKTRNRSETQRLIWNMRMNNCFYPDKQRNTENFLWWWDVLTGIIASRNDFIPSPLCMPTKLQQIIDRAVKKKNDVMIGRHTFSIKRTYQRRQEIVRKITLATKWRI